MDRIQKEITALLLKWSKGDGDALEQLIPAIYPELRRIAHRHMGRENAGHTLQTSALINEAYMRLVDQDAIEWQNREHFFAVAARVMRNILIDHARKYLYSKRGGGAQHVDLDNVAALKDQRASEFIELDCALKSLGQIDPRKLRILELRFFGGLSIDETAEIMKLSPVTINREWRSARAWLLREISGSPE